MPYIKSTKRYKLDQPLESLQCKISTPGELNYVISRLAASLIESEGSNYDAFNQAIGVLECAKLELYRRLVAPYEEEKIRTNGDILEYEDYL